MRKTLIIILALFFCRNVNAQGILYTNLAGYEAVKAELKAIVGEETLSEWNMLILAICGVESTYKKTTNSNFHGHMQISRAYVKEVNRLSGKNYSYEDAKSLKHSAHMHNIINEHKNKQKNITKAIKIHNGRPEYIAKVKKELKYIKEHERRIENQRR